MPGMVSQCSGMPVSSLYVELLEDRAPCKALEAVQEVPSERTAAALSAADETLGQSSRLPQHSTSPQDFAPPSLDASFGYTDRIPTRTVGDSGSLDDQTTRQPAPVGGYASDIAVQPVAASSAGDMEPGQLPGQPPSLH